VTSSHSLQTSSSAVLIDNCCGLLPPCTVSWWARCPYRHTFSSVKGNLFRHSLDCILHCLLQKYYYFNTTNIFTLTFRSLSETFIGRSLFNSSSGSCHDSDATWQDCILHCMLLLCVFQVLLMEFLQSFSVHWQCWLCIRKSIWPEKIEWWGSGIVIWLLWGANDLHMVQLMPLPPHHLWLD